MHHGYVRCRTRAPWICKMQYHWLLPILLTNWSENTVATQVGMVNILSLECIVMTQTSIGDLAIWVCIYYMLIMLMNMCKSGNNFSYTFNARSGGNVWMQKTFVVKNSKNWFQWKHILITDCYLVILFVSCWKLTQSIAVDISPFWHDKLWKWISVLLASQAMTVNISPF